MKLASKFVSSFIAVVLASGRGISASSDSDEISREEWLRARRS